MQDFIIVLYDGTLHTIIADNIQEARTMATVIFGDNIKKVEAS